MNRKQYCALFDTKIKTDPYTGKDKQIAVYIGPYYALEGATFSKKRLCMWLLGAWVLCVGIFIACGLSNADSSRCFYILPFFMMLPFPLFYEGLAVIRMARMPERFTAIEKDESTERAGRCTTGLMIICGLHTVGEIVFLLLGGARGRLLTEVCTLLGIFAIGLCAFALWRILKGLPIHEVQKARTRVEKSTAPEKWGTEPEPNA